MSSTPAKVTREKRILVELADKELSDAAGRIATLEVKTRDPSNELSVEQALANIQKARVLIKNSLSTEAETKSGKREVLEGLRNDIAEELDKDCSNEIGVTGKDFRGYRLGLRFILSRINSQLKEIEK